MTNAISEERISDPRGTNGGTNGTRFRLSPDFGGCFALCLVRGCAVGECFHYMAGCHRGWRIR